MPETSRFETAAIHARFLRRVTPVVRVRPIPHRSSGAFRGLCNILGELVLCVDLHHILGLMHTTGDAQGESVEFVSDRKNLFVKKIPSHTFVQYRIMLSAL
jgi:chemotaxis signal transduction protein